VLQRRRRRLWQKKWKEGKNEAPGSFCNAQQIITVKGQGDLKGLTTERARLHDESTTQKLWCFSSCLSLVSQMIR
jgi:hypothetical protein